MMAILGTKSVAMSLLANVGTENRLRAASCKTNVSDSVIFQ